MLEARETFRLPTLDCFRELIRGLPPLVRASGADGVEVIGDGLIVRSQLAEKKKDQDSDQNDAEREDDELEEDGSGRLFGEVGWRGSRGSGVGGRRIQGCGLRLPIPDRRLLNQRPVPITTKSGRYPLSCVGASGTTMASLSQTDSQRRQATHFFSSTKAIL